MTKPPCGRDRYLGSNVGGLGLEVEGLWFEVHLGQSPVYDWVAQSKSFHMSHLGTQDKEDTCTCVHTWCIYIPFMYTLRGWKDTGTCCRVLADDDIPPRWLMSHVLGTNP